MDLTLALIILASLAALCVFIVYRRRRGEVDEFWKETVTTRAFQMLRGQVATGKAVTPEGREVFLEQGLVPVAECLAAIDRGVEKTFVKCECAGYPVNRSQHRVRVIVLKSELAPESRTPAFRVPIDIESPYFNGEYDQMKGQGGSVHYILAAGLTAASGAEHGDVIVIPDAGREFADYIASAAEHEMEHVTLCYYDGEKYEATKYHGDGQGHPLIANCPGIVDAISAPFFCAGAIVK